MRKDLSMFQDAEHPKQTNQDTSGAEESQPVVLFESQPIGLELNQEQDLSLSNK